MSLFIFTPNIFGQTIRIDNGLSISSMHSKNTDFLNKSITSYHTSIGIDYLENKYYYLSSSIGLIRKGGKEFVHLSNQDDVELKNSWNFLHIKTSIRLKAPLTNNFFVYAGIAPKIDILIDSPNFQDIFYPTLNYQLNKYSFGTDVELGAIKDIERFRIGLSLAYLINIGKVVNTPTQDVIKPRNNTFLISLSLGYKL